MTEPQSPYQLNDLLVIIGQSTVELAYLRTQLALAQQRLRELEPEQAPADGVAEVIEEHAHRQ